MSTVANIPAETRKAMITSVQNIHARMMRAENVHQQFELKKMKALLLSMMSPNMTQEGFDKLNKEYRAIKVKVIIASPARVNEMAQKLEQKRTKLAQVDKATGEIIQHTNACAAYYFAQQANNMIDRDINRFNKKIRQSMRNSVKSAVQHIANKKGITDQAIIQATIAKNIRFIEEAKTNKELVSATVTLGNMLKNGVGDAHLACHPHK